jgi:hypothetical protein
MSSSWAQKFKAVVLYKILRDILSAWDFFEVDETPNQEIKDIFLNIPLNIGSFRRPKSCLNQNA